MTAETHAQLASFIWSICNLLRGPYKRNEYRKVILPLTVLRRFDCLLTPTKDRVLEEFIGQTEDFPRRLVQHEKQEVSWTAPHLPVEPIHWEVFATREESVKREQDLKSGFGRKWLKREHQAGRLAAASRQAGAWINEKKTKVGYEIPLNRHFYRYEPPRPLEAIQADIRKLEGEIMEMLAEVAQ